jgi:hypothetical protein
LPNLVQHQALKSAASRQVSVPGDRTHGVVECCLRFAVYLAIPSARLEAERIATPFS